MMDNSKAKKAMELAMMAKLMGEASGPVNPEIQAAMPAMQPADGLLNPYGRIGTVAPNTFNPGNMIDGSPDPRARDSGRSLMP